MTGLPLNCAATLLGIGTFWLTPPPFFLALRRSRYEYPQRPGLHACLPGHGGHFRVLRHIPELNR